MKIPAKALLRLFPLLGTCLCLEGQSTSANLSKSNILFVSIDDFNDWGPTQLQGEPFDVDTPNFDSLATQSVVFRDAHCNAPSCNPSRASIMSGIHPTSTGVYGNGHNWLANKLFDDILLIPEYFKKHGYATLGGGKIYHANQEDEADRKGLFSPRGWDDFFLPSMPNCPSRACRVFQRGGTRENSIGAAPTNRLRRWETTKW